jgi:hypothetical protein
MNLLEPVVLPNAVTVVLLRVAAALVISSCLAVQWFCAKKILSAQTAYLAYVANFDKFIKKTATVTAIDHFNNAQPGDFEPQRLVHITYTYEMLGGKWSSYCMSFSKCSAKPEEYSTVLGRQISQITSGDSITAYVSQEIPVTAYLKVDSVDEARTSLRVTWVFWGLMIFFCLLFQWETRKTIEQAKNQKGDERKSLL